jgi:hypothetical protein
VLRKLDDDAQVGETTEEGVELRGYAIVRGISRRNISAVD